MCSTKASTAATSSPDFHPTCATCLSAKTRRHCRCLKWAQASANVTKHKHSNAPLPFLYRAMKLCNDCDLNYRASKNKRLLVELTLIQVAQLTAEGGRRCQWAQPKQAIKPIFTQPAAAQQPQATAAMPQQTVQPAVQTNSTPQPAATQHSNATTPHATPAAVLMAQGREEKKIPVMKMSGLGGLHQTPPYRRGTKKPFI